jgi:hypothetical protein
MYISPNLLSESIFFSAIVTDRPGDTMKFLKEIAFWASYAEAYKKKA